MAIWMHTHTIIVTNLSPDLRELGETLGLGDCHRPWYRRERYPDYGVSS